MMHFPRKENNWIIWLSYGRTCFRRKNALKGLNKCISVFAGRWIYFHAQPIPFSSTSFIEWFTWQWCLLVISPVKAATCELAEGKYFRWIRDMRALYDARYYFRPPFAMLLALLMFMRIIWCAPTEFKNSYSTDLNREVCQRIVF